MPVGGAAVTVRSLETGATRVVTTNDEGKFRALALPVGQQEVKAEKSGFKAAVRTGIDLVVGQEAVVTLRLEVGDVVQQVTVVGDAPVVNTTTASVSGVVGEQQGEGAAAQRAQLRQPDHAQPRRHQLHRDEERQYHHQRREQLSRWRGGGRRDNLFLRNGIEYTGASQLAVTPGGVSGDLLGIDAIREFNVLTDTYGAEYGKRAGGQVIVVTQSGTNALHGSVFEFLRNSALG